MGNGGKHIKPRKRQDAPASPYLPIAIAVAAFFLAICIGIGCFLVFSGSGNGKESAASAQRTPSASFTVADQRENAASTTASRLENAIEGVDGNGVAHGTTSDGTKFLLYGHGTAGNSAEKVSLAAVGDVFATNMNFPILEAYGKSSGLDYDFRPYYKGIESELSAYDVRFINQETPCAGTDGHDYAGYPVFNTPDSSIHALADVGFNVANFNSNHTWDMGEAGILRTQSLFAQHPAIALIGSYSSADDRSTLRLVERNGAVIAFLSYSYGDNWYGTDPAAFPNNYYTCQFDKSVMAGEIARARKSADAVVVYMHWGSEYTTEPNEQQTEYAQFLADQDVDLVIGSHAHILQPIRYYTGANGKRVPVVFGLSDFITGWTITDTILSGMFTCDFIWHENALAVENCAFMPAIEWSDGGDTYVRFLKDMTPAEIDANTRTPDVENDNAYLHQFIDALGMETPVAW